MTRPLLRLASLAYGLYGTAAWLYRVNLDCREVRGWRW